MTNATPAPTGGAIAAMEGVTTTTLILVAIGAVVVIALMFFGAHLKRKRKAAERALRAEASAVATPGPVSEPAPAPVRDTPAAAPLLHSGDVAHSPPAERPAAPAPVPSSSATELGEDTGAPASAPVIHDAPVAPAPPPLAGSDTPVVAAAPFDASPASVAADLATPPSDASSSANDTDDLTVMKGVGPRLAVRLGELGVTRYADLAELTPEQADALDAQLGSFRGRLSRDRWIEQAGYLARGDRAGFEAAFGKL